MKKKTINVTLALLALWLLTIIAAAILHWRVIRYFSVAILLGAIGYLTVSIIYSFLETKKPENPEQQPKEKNEP